ncbi:MAG: hypothetical protein ACLPKZ_05285, partial [Acidimicrobiales bacterium]
MKRTKKARAHRLLTGAAVMALATGGVVATGVGSTAGASSKVTITAAYAANTTFDTTPLGYTWWTTVQKEVEKAYPNITVKLVPVDGGEPDFL